MQYNTVGLQHSGCGSGWRSRCKSGGALHDRRCSWHSRDVSAPCWRSSAAGRASAHTSMLRWRRAGCTSRCSSARTDSWLSHHLSCAAGLLRKLRSGPGNLSRAHETAQEATTAGIRWLLAHGRHLAGCPLEPLRRRCRRRCVSWGSNGPRVYSRLPGRYAIQPRQRRQPR